MHGLFGTSASEIVINCFSATISSLVNIIKLQYNSSVPEGKLMGVELIGVYKLGLINWG